MAAIPVDHVVAETAAAPLAAETGLRLALTALDPSFAAAASPTGQLWREVEKTVLGSFPAFSVDEAVAIRDGIWFHDPADQVVPLGLYLRRLAGSFLCYRGTTAYPALPQDERAAAPGHTSQAALARRAWRWLSFALPPDLLLAALGKDDRGPDRVELLTPALAHHLADRGFAEIHLHLGAAFDFPLWWLGALHAIAHHDLKPDAFAAPGAALGEGRRLGSWLIRAALARYVLAAFLAHRRPFTGFPEYLHSEIRRRLVEDGTPIDFSLLLQGLDELEQGELPWPDRRFAAYQDLYARLTKVTATPVLSGLVGARQADPITPLLAARSGGGRPAEMRFVHHALAYLESPAGRRPAALGDPHFATLFWQVVRVRVLCYRHVVQRPMTPGLQWFVRFFGRIKPARRPLISPALLLESAAELSGAGRGLRSLEVRTSPWASVSELLEFVDTVDEAARKAHASGYELGIVFHFTKHRGGGASGGLPVAHGRGSHADPRSPGNPAGYRYSRYFHAKRGEALALEELLRRWPLALRVVRGLDVCTDELGIPNWVLAPLMARVRRGADDAAVALRRLLGRTLPPLRTTAHAGEDFVHLLTGLRHVDEAIEDYELRENDRLGHAVALGVDPREWARRAGRVPMTRGERLFDLMWEWSWYSRQGDELDGGRLHRIEHEIAVLSRRVFSKAIPPFDLEQLIADLRDPRRLVAVGFPTGPRPDLPPESRLGLLCRYLTDPGLFQHGQEIVWVDPSAEGEELARLQAELRAKLGTRCIAVEVNPTSNLLIGDLGDLLNHPIWRLQPPRPGGDAPPVAICIGSDDPLVFGSDLRQEYQWLKDAMTLAGLSDEETRRWLDRTRTCGLEHRFTLQRADCDFHLRLRQLFNLDGPAQSMVL